MLLYGVDHRRICIPYTTCTSRFLSNGTLLVGRVQVSRDIPQLDCALYVIRGGADFGTNSARGCKFRTRSNVRSPCICMYLRHLVPPASLPAFPTPSPANDSSRLSKSVTALVYTLDAKLPASYSLTNAFSRNTRIQSTITPTTSTYYSGFVQSPTGRGSCDLRFLRRHV